MHQYEMLILVCRYRISNNLTKFLIDIMYEYSKYSTRTCIRNYSENSHNMRIM